MAEELDIHQLYRVVYEGNLREVRRLIRSRANVNERSLGGETALHWCGKSGHIKVLDYLLKHKGDLNIVADDGNTPLHFASLFDHPHAVRKMLKKGSSVDEVVGNTKKTALHLAAHQGNVDVVQTLLHLGANPLTEDKRGEIPIEKCARMCKRVYEEIWDTNFLELEGLLADSQHMKCVYEFLHDLPDATKRSQFLRLNRHPRVAYMILYSQVALRQSWGNTRLVHYDFSLIAPPRDEDSVLSEFYDADSMLIFSHPLVVRFVEDKIQKFGIRGDIIDYVSQTISTLTVAYITAYYWSPFFEDLDPDLDRAADAILIAAEVILGIFAGSKVFHVVKAISPCWKSIKLFNSHEEGYAKTIMGITLVLILITRLLWFLTSTHEIQMYNVFVVVFVLYLSAYHLLALFFSYSKECSYAKKVYMGTVLVYFVEVWISMMSYMNKIKTSIGSYRAGTCFMMATATSQFFTIFLIVLMGFAFAFICLFGHLPLCDNWYKVITWLLVMGVGHLEPLASDIREDGPYIVILIAYTMMVTFILLIFLTALMDNKFSHARERQKQTWNFDRARHILAIEQEFSDEEFRKHYTLGVTEEVQFDHQTVSTERDLKLLSYLRWFIDQYQHSVGLLEKEIKLTRPILENRRGKALHDVNTTLMEGKTFLTSMDTLAHASMPEHPASLTALLPFRHSPLENHSPSFNPTFDANSNEKSNTMAQLDVPSPRDSLESRSRLQSSLLPMVTRPTSVRTLVGKLDGHPKTGSVVFGPNPESKSPTDLSPYMPSSPNDGPTELISSAPLSPNDSIIEIGQYSVRVHPCLRKAVRPESVPRP
ncbi:hypothetical protein AAMO2058_000102700 [Amorphochlora amoebiformis]